MEGTHVAMMLWLSTRAVAYSGVYHICWLPSSSGGHRYLTVTTASNVMYVEELIDLLDSQTLGEWPSVHTRGCAEQNMYPLPCTAVGMHYQVGVVLLELPEHCVASVHGSSPV